MRCWLESQKSYLNNSTCLQRVTIRRVACLNLEMWPDNCSQVSGILTGISKLSPGNMLLLRWTHSLYWSVVLYSLYYFLYPKGHLVILWHCVHRKKQTTLNSQRKSTIQGKCTNGEMNGESFFSIGLLSFLWMCVHSLSLLISSQKISLYS